MNYIVYPFLLERNSLWVMRSIQDLTLILLGAAVLYTIFSENLSIPLEKQDYYGIIKP